MTKFTAILKYQGGLGNQLFQWSFAHNISQTHEVAVDTSWFDSSTTRLFELGDLGKSCNHMKTLQMGDRSARMVGSRFRTAKYPFFSYRIVDDKNYMKSNWARRSKLIISGYFQSEDLIKNSRMYFLEELLKYIEVQVLSASEAMPDNVVAIHVRRGDYLNPSIDENIGVLSDEYFVKQVRNLHHEAWILTENANEVHDLVKLIGQKCKVKVFDSSHFNSWETLKLIVDAKYFIGSNSSFSWWGAFLRDQENKESSIPGEWTRQGMYPHPGKTLMNHCKFVSSDWTLS